MAHDEEQSVEERIYELERRISDLERICRDLPEALKKQAKEKKQKKRQEELDALGKEKALLARCHKDPNKVTEKLYLTPDLQKQASADPRAHWFFDARENTQRALGHANFYKKCIKCNLILPGSMKRF